MEKDRKIEKRDTYFGKIALTSVSLITVNKVRHHPHPSPVFVNGLRTFQVLTYLFKLQGSGSDPTGRLNMTNS